MTVRIRTKAGFMAAAALSALIAVGCAAPPATGRTAVADGVKFNYALAPAGVPGTYHLTLALADAKTGAAINDANVAVDLYGPGIVGGSTLVNLARSTDGPAAYGADVALPQVASYRLTFQVNRPAPAPSAEVVFSAARPAATG